MTFVDYFSGSQGGCPNGGAIYAAGTPPVNAYVCNGTSGTNGTNGTATRPDGPCFDNTNRYVDCGNGTVTDTVTGLIWLKQADCLANNDWAAANVSAAGLKDGDCGGNLTDRSSPGDWRLPTKDEWSATIAHARTYDLAVSALPLPGGLGCTMFGQGVGYPAGEADATHLPPSLTNDAGTGCKAVGPSSFAGVVSGDYWSSTTFEAGSGDAPEASLDYGFVLPFGKGNTLRVWPVRGGAGR